MREYRFTVGDTPYIIMATTLREALKKLRDLVKV